MQRTRRLKPGFTLLELMLGIAIIAILLGIGMPSISRVVELISHRAHATDVESFLNLQRQAAVHGSKHVFVTIDTNANCIGASHTKICDCSSKNACQINNAEAVIAIDKNALALDDLSLAKKNHIRFSKRLGTAVGHNGSFGLRSKYFQTQFIVSALGRSRLCVSKGNISGLHTC